jgi:hypothetical protein
MRGRLKVGLTGERRFVVEPVHAIDFAEGQWVDQRGRFMAAVAAGPVNRLLGKKDLGTAEFPPIETALIDGEIAFRQHRGGHTTGPNWPTFLAFADRYIKGPSPAAGSKDDPR